MTTRTLSLFFILLSSVVHAAETDPWDYVPPAQTAEVEVPRDWVGAPQPQQNDVAGSNLLLNNLDVQSSELGSALDGIGFTAALAGGVTFPVVGAILATFDKNPCLALRSFVESLGTSEFTLHAGKCRDKRQPLRDITRVAPWNFIAPKSKFGFTPMATIARQGQKVFNLARVHFGQVDRRQKPKGSSNMMACTRLFDLVERMQVTPQQVSRSRGRFTHALKFRGGCELLEQGYAVMNISAVLDDGVEPEPTIPAQAAPSTPAGPGA